MLIKKFFSHLKSYLAAHKAAKPSVPLYAIYKCQDDSIVGDPLYYTSTRDDALTAISRLLQIKHFDHYSRWCSLNRLDPGFPSVSWSIYLATVLYPDSDFSQSDNDYAIVKTLFSPDDVSVFIRLLSSVSPLGLDFEAEEESEAFNARNNAKKNNGN